MLVSVLARASPSDSTSTNAEQKKPTLVGRCSSNILSLKLSCFSDISCHRLPVSFSPSASFPNLSSLLIHHQRNFHFPPPRHFWHWSSSLSRRQSLFIWYWISKKTIYLLNFADNFHLSSISHFEWFRRKTKNSSPPLPTVLRHLYLLLRSFPGIGTRNEKMSVDSDENSWPDSFLFFFLVWVILPLQKWEYLNIQSYFVVLQIGCTSLENFHVTSPSKDCKVWKVSGFKTQCSC